MDVLDYGRSYITFVTQGRGNNARIQVEAACRLISGGEVREEAWLVASCKAEDTYAERNLLRSPGYDFAVIFTRERYRILRIGPFSGAAGGESGLIADRFEEAVFQLRTVPAEECPTPDAIIQATLDGRPLVARNLIGDPDGAAVVLEYPVKTTNVNPERGVYQTDTGPLIAPPGANWSGGLDELEVAFAAFNTPSWVELICRRPYVLDGGGTIDHFHATRRHDAVNTILAV